MVTGSDVGYKAEEQPVSNHDVHASMLYLMGMDHKRLTYYFNGRNMRLTDVAGELIKSPAPAKRPPETPRPIQKKALSTNTRTTE